MFLCSYEIFGSALNLTIFRNALCFIPCLTDSLVAHKNNGYKTAQKVSHTILPFLNKKTAISYNRGLCRYYAVITRDGFRALSARLV